MPRPNDASRFRPSRREALKLVAATAAMIALPGVAVGCRRRKAGAASTQTGGPRNLDDVGDLANFRPPLPAAEPAVRVRVMRVRDRQPPPLRIGAPGQWVTLRYDDGSETPGGQTAGRGLALQGPVEVSMTDRGWSVVDGQGFRASVREHATFTLAPAADSEDPLISVMAGGSDSRQYRGTLRLVSRHDLDDVDSKTGAVARPSRAFDVVNDVPIESYLPGVLAGELYAAWQPDTFAAQAIAARSFAATECAVFAGRRHYDVTNTASSQMYLGVVGNVRAIEAVQHTRGQMLAFDGLLVSGYYSSCCGGLAASATDVIGSNPVNDVAPLRGRSGSDVCTEAPVYRWTVEQPLDDLARRLGGYARERSMSELGALQRPASIDVSASNANGRPTRIAITDARGSRAEITAEHFRRAANYASPDGRIKPPDKDLRSSNLTATLTASKATFNGFGFGHGVGLCQHGAQTLAKGGMRYEDIVRWYYPAVEITNAYL